MDRQLSVSLLTEGKASFKINGNSHFNMNGDSNVEKEHSYDWK